MKLIADSGSTKTDWACVDDKGTCVRFISAGYNPNYITKEYMVNDIRLNFPPQLSVEDVTNIYFYGAGVTELQYPFVKECLLQVFPADTSVFVSMDLLGAAHALLGNKPGFAAILGTGTNSCIYDGTKVTLNIDSLGFILGDEGSGGYIGKRLICDYIRGDMPKEVYGMVRDRIKLTGDELIDQIYTKPFPNRFCAQFCKFVNDNVDTHPYFRQLVTKAFEALFTNIISHYPHYQDYALNCVGSVGWQDEAILTEVAAKFGMKMGKVIQYPIQGLIDYYTQQ
jgi:glucosamine kinase